MKQKSSLNLKDALYPLYGTKRFDERYITFKSKSLYKVFKHYLKRTKFLNPDNSELTSLAVLMHAGFDDKKNYVLWEQRASDWTNYAILGNFFRITHQDWRDDFYTQSRDNPALDRESGRPVEEGVKDSNVLNILWNGNQRIKVTIPEECIHEMNTWASYIASEDTVESFVERLSFIDRLEAYIERIESHKREERPNQIDYAYGFWFFAESRAGNRQKNHELAKQLCEKLKSGSNIKDVFSDAVEVERIHSSGSSELSAIIKDGQEKIETFNPSRNF